MKYHLITYGCQMNTADSEEMAQPLIDRGFIATADPQQADVILMNTCTVRDQAEHRAKSNLGRLKDWKGANPNRVLIVAGCAASRWGDSIKKRYPYIDLVAPATRIEEFPQLVESVLKDRWDFEAENSAGFPLHSTSSPYPQPLPIKGARDNEGKLFGSETTAYITIMRGCNYSCSYCIVPQVRGRETYRSPDEILSDVRSKVVQGYGEVMLLGQTVNSYYHRIGGSADRRIGETSSADTPDRRTAGSSMDFADLLRLVDSVPGVERIRFMSPHPRHMRDRVIEAMRASKKVARHIHLPVQSGSNRVLLRMNRLYTREGYLSIIEKMRDALPGLLITTDVIVGYPGETEEDFKATLSLMDTIRFNGVFAFKFSPRPGTLAGAETDDVSAEIKESRLQRVLEAAG